ncbi:MAG: LysR family transcriptional regulator [Myxococcales bacterium]|nr:LysR family transcriptional regulator [Myxococcales bacterium]MCB9649456.1 LysR family transcriptional regulator [Deltaproteobacteria bacterium]
MPRRPLSTINLNQLLALDALLTEVNVTRAAQRVGVTQSSMSHSLRALRELFEDELLVRGREGMQLTAKAEALVGPLHRTLRALQQLVDEDPEFEPATSQREFRISSADFAAALVLPPLLAALERTAPGVRLVLRPLDVRGTALALEREHLDLAIGPPLPETVSVIEETLLTERYVCVTRRAHPRGAGPWTLDEYCAARHLLVSPTGSGTGVVDDALEALGRRRDVVCRVASFLSAPPVVAESDVVWTALESAVRGSVARFALTVTDVPLELPTPEVRLAWHRRFDRDPALMWLRALLHAAVRAT